MQFAAIFVMTMFLVAALTRWYPPEGWDWGCCDGVPKVGRRMPKDTFAASSLAWSWSEPM